MPIILALERLRQNCEFKKKKRKKERKRNKVRIMNSRSVWAI
jgi:hypothetical protein